MSESREITLREAREKALEGLRKAEQERADAAQREADYYASLSTDPSPVAGDSALLEALRMLDLLYDGKPDGFRRQLETEDFGDVLDHALPAFRTAYAKAADALDAAKGAGE